MDISLRIIAILLLVAAGGYFAIAEISLAGSRKVRLTQLEEQGAMKGARLVLKLQEKNPDLSSLLFKSASMR